MARSITHNANTGALPDFRNPGILLRMLLIVNGVALLGSLLQVGGFREWPAQIAENAAAVEPLLILSLLVLAALNNVLRRLTFFAAAIAVIVIELALTAALHALAESLYFADASMLARRLLIVALTTGMLLVYFDLRGRALSPALAEARLQALQTSRLTHLRSGHAQD